MSGATLTFVMAVCLIGLWLELKSSGEWNPSEVQRKIRHQLKEKRKQREEQPRKFTAKSNEKSL